MKPVFNELVTKIQKHINLKHYSLVTKSKNIIYDDKSLHTALTSASGHLEITLEYKNLPEIIPKMTTCLPAEHPNEIQSHRNDSRKDSGVFFDDDTMKNETFSMDNHPRKLPYPSSTSLTYHYNTHAHFIDSKMVDPSPSLYRPQFKLPTIKAIADSHIEKLDTQLAPIHSAPVSKKRFGSIKPSDDSHTCHFRGETGKVCGLSFRRPYDLSRHKNTHLKNRPFSYCEVCGKRFTRRDALRRHERVQGHTSKGQDMSKQLRQRLPQT